MVLVDDNEGKIYLEKWSSRISPSVLKALSELMVCLDAIMSMNFEINVGSINLLKSSYEFGLWKFPVKKHSSDET